MSATFLKILFIVNPGSGKNKTDWPKEIKTFFAGKPQAIELYELPDLCQTETIRQKLKA